jgi:hypothetical protein
MEEVWFKPLVWADYRLALLFTLILPLLLLIWSAVAQIEAIRRLLLIYWRVASLLLIGIYLLVPSWPLGFAVNFAARVLIPISLWFWVDLNDEIKDLPASFLKLVLTSWRWAVTIYCSLGAIASLPFLSCAFSPSASGTGFCQVWLEAPWQYQSIFHPNASTGFLGFLGIVGLIVYVLYFAYFLFFRLGKQGRSALEQ